MTPSRVVVVVLALAVAVAPAALASPSRRPAPGRQLLTYLWNYDNWLLRPYVNGVALSGGQTVMVQAKPRLTGATANVRATLRNDPKFADAARHICRVTLAGVENLHLRATISAVRVWSVDGHTLARC